MLWTVLKAGSPGENYCLPASVLCSHCNSQITNSSKELEMVLMTSSLPSPLVLLMKPPADLRMKRWASLSQQREMVLPSGQIVFSPSPQQENTGPGPEQTSWLPDLQEPRETMTGQMLCDLQRKNVV